MKKIYMLNNSQGVIGLFLGLKSRISPMNHRIWTVIGPMLLVAFGLFGVNESAWGKKNTDGTITIISGKGSVSIGAYYKPNSWTTKTGASGSISTIDNAANIGVPKNVAYNDRGNSEDGWLTFTATAATGYTFYGWCTNSDCSDASPDKTKSKQYNEDKGWTGLGHSNLTIVRYTKFVPITYKIAFDKNGGTHGSTAGINSVTYDGDVTLTKNGFYKAKYVVTYDINGGTCATTVDTAYYPFDGWATTAGGTKAYNDNATLTKPNFKSTQDETQTLFAKWGSGTTSVKLPTPTAAPAYDGDGSYSFAGWYDGDTKVGVGGGAYTPTKNVTLKAKWTLTKEPGFAGAVAGLSQSLKVGGTFNFVFSNTSTTSPSASSSDYFYYVIETTTAPTGNRNGSSHPNDVISFSGTTVTALNNGVATIKFYQNADASNNIAAGESDTYTFTVTKNDPVFTWTPQTYYYNSTYEDIFSSSNHDTQLTCSTTNSGAAEMVNGTNNYQKTLKTYNGASATITIEQAENYKWNYKKVDTYAVTNNKANNHVAFTIDNDNYSTFQTTDKTTNASWSNPGFSLCDGGWDTQDDYVVIKFTGIPDKLNFDKQLGKSVNQLPGTYLCQVYQSADGTSWGDAAVWTHNQRVENTNGNEVQLSPSTRYIKFAYHGTVHCYYKNINVTELQYFRRKGANTTLDFATNVKNQEPAVQSFVVEHANAGYQTSVTAPEHYLVSKDNVNFASEVVYSTNETAVTGGDKMGTFTVYVKYLADAIGTHNANVTVHNNLRTDFNVPVTGTTKDKIATQIEYCGASSYSVDAANIASTTLFRVRDIDNDTIVNISGVGISLSCAENDQFSIVGGNALDPKCGGTNNVKPSFAGNDTYAAATNNNANFAITITRLADEINFDNARSTLVVGDEIDLSGWASAESESEITYEVMSSDQLTGSIKIENGKLIALSAGTVRIKATSEGNCLYDSGYDFHNMKVRNPGDPCGSLLLDKSATVKCGITAKTSESPQEYAISAGPMDELKFKIWRVATAGDQVTIRFVDKDGNAVPNGTYTYSAGSLGTSKPDNYTVIDVSNITGATKLQIYGGGLLNKYVSNVQITQKAYLTTYVGSTQLEPTANVTMPEVKACNTSTKDITIKYSDLTPIQLSHTNDVFTYEIYKGENKVGFFDNDCRGFGTYTVRCICTPTSKGEYSDVLTLTASGQSQTINLSLNANAPDRTIVWDIPTGNTITATQSLDLTAYAETSCQSPAGSVYYTASPADAVTIDPIDGNHITFKKAAAVTVTAHTTNSDDYNNAPTVDKVWTVSKVGVQMTKLPTITSTITYGDTKSVVAWDNKSWVAVSVLNDKDTVQGIIDCAGPDNFTTAGPQDLTFNFYPTNVNTYDVLQFTVPVNVQKLETLNVPVALSFCAGESETFHGETYMTAGTDQINAVGATRDTVYNVTVTVLQPTTGTDSKTITVGDNESWNGKDLSGYAVGSHEVVFHTENVAGCDSTVTLSLTVVPLSNVFNNAEGDGDWGNANNWESGIVPTSNPDIIVTGALEINDSITVGSLTIEQTGSVAVISGGTLTVKGTSDYRSEYGDVHVLNDGELALGSSADLQVRHFTLDAKLAGKNALDVKEAAASGQVDSVSNLHVNGDAYFQMTFDPKGKISFGWYDFVVPFPVNISDGIFREGDLVNHLVSGVDFIVQEYSETRNANKQKAWSNFYGTMQPGRVYTIGFNYDPDFDQNVFVFKKASGAIGGPTEFATQYTAGSGTTDDFGWNGLGNGMLQHGYITGDFSHMQVYNHAENKYDLLTGKNPTFAIGTSFFVQVDHTTPTMTWNPADADKDHPLYAPKRETFKVEEFLLSMRGENQIDACDHFYISGSEEATGEYVIGHDLRKMGNPTEAKTAQMWATKNGKKLCDIETRMVNYGASSDLNFFAPQAGTFELMVEEMPEDATLYLTYNGNVIWDLTASPYVLNLTKGTTTGYGLRIEAANAPQITTGVEDVQGDGTSVRKVIIDNTMYIITPEGEIYNAIGKKVQ